MAKIKSITRKNIKSEKLYNLAVDQDESYVANEIVVHNCKSFLTVQLTGDKKNKPVDPEGLRPVGTAEEVAKMNKETWGRGADRTRPIDERLARGRTTN